MNDLTKYKKNFFSQHGEDGIIEEILRRLNKFRDNQYCEFGAWDGMHLSNVCALIKKNQCKALLIEPDKKKFKELCKNFPDKEIIKLNKYVETQGENKLDNLLKKFEFNLNFDFLSIDVDSIDFHIFKSINVFKPKIICIEFNPTIPNSINFVQPNDGNINQGSSAKSIVELAEIKKYSLISATKTNLFFVHEDFKNLVVGEKKYNLNDIVNDNEVKNFIFYGYDGTIFTSKKVVLPWHNLFVKDLNVLKKYIRKYPKNYNFFEKILFKLYRKIFFS